MKEYTRAYMHGSFHPLNIIPFSVVFLSTCLYYGSIWMKRTSHALDHRYLALTLHRILHRINNASY